MFFIFLPGEKEVIPVLKFGLLPIRGAYNTLIKYSTKI